jgi:hypothetical protein
MKNSDARLHDHAKDILSNAPLDDSTKADLWDHWHDARDTHELSTRLADMDIPSDVAESLIAAKKLSEPSLTALDRATAAIHRMTQIDPQTLELAEKYPNVFRHLIQATREEK